jgi:hypothetical protein
MTKLKMWSPNKSWEQNEECWDEGIPAAKEKNKLKTLKTLPQIPGITPQTAKNLKWKSLKYMMTHDKGFHILKGMLKHPMRYGWEFVKSVFKAKSYRREGDFFFYGLQSIDDFENLLNQEDTLFVVGFSYCHKPLECPSGRFTDACIRDPNHPVCRQCFIGKCIHALPEKGSLPLLIPTIHYIGKEIFEIVHKNPNKRVIFMITACEMTLEMFGDWGNMVGVQGIGVRLDGRICNTMRAFELSENGIKPGLTVVLDETQKTMLKLISKRWKLFGA